MQEPAEVAGDRIDPVAAPEQPEPSSLLILHPEIVAHREQLARPQPPFAGDPLRPVREAIMYRSGDQFKSRSCRRG